MDKCCKAVLSLLRKMSHVTGTADKSLYPDKIVVDDIQNNGIQIEINNIKERIDTLLLGEESEYDDTLLKEIMKLLEKVANVTGKSSTSLYPREDKNQDEEIRSLAKEVQGVKDNLRKVSNVTGISETAIYPLSIKDENGKIYNSLDNISDLNQKMSNVTGLSNDLTYPSFLPKQLTKNNNETEEIQNLAQWQAYLFDVFDELIGQFPIEFKIEGDKSDPRNIAEALGEIYGLAVKNVIDLHENKMTTARALAESGQSKLNTVKTIENINAIASFLDFDWVEKEIEIQMSFNPLAYEDENNDGDPDNLENFLTPSVQKIKVMAPGDDSLSKQLLLLIQAAQIIKALYWHKIPSNPAAAKANLENLLSLGKDIAKDLSSSTWKEFIDNVQDNWENKQKIDGDNDSSDNPKIKEL
ncbi:MAG: hypothetical protein F6K39_26400 [Okeania sp. SIO3B3]|nr:hypothetical protein [Okeania sp. SIO3B3]